MEGIVTTMGHSPIPGGGFAGLGDAVIDARARFGAFAGSSDLVTIANRALGRLRTAADEARGQCDDRGWFQRGVEWLADSTVSDTICDRADQLELMHSELTRIVNQSWTTDQQIVDALYAINNATDISDLIDLAESTSAGHVIREAAYAAPGTAIGWVGEAAGEVAGGIAAGLPWWVWAAGGLFLAVNFGIIDFRRLRA